MKNRFINPVILVCCMVFLLSVPVNAEGDPNVDNGGGGMGSGSETNFWHSGDDGIRVTVVDAISGKAVSASVDLSNHTNTDIKLDFGKVSKSDYREGRGLSLKVSSYSSYVPALALPRIISSASGQANLLAIKSYFTDEQVLRALCSYMGFNYDTLLSGNYKLMIEPIAYVTYNGNRMAFTATEAALYNQLTGGGLRSKLVSLTHKNLPLALFLERSDLGYPSWTGSRTEKVSDDQIISSLGIGIVRFTDAPGQDPNLDAADYEYRTDTDVVTAVYVSGGQSDPDNSVSVYFHILGNTYTVNNVYYPEDGQQIAWVMWHTPSTPQRVNITVTTSGGKPSKTTITANINQVEDNPPPNPVADDRNDSYDRGQAQIPSNAEKTEANWSVWKCKWHEKLVWHENWQWSPGEHEPNCPVGCTIEHGEWVDEGEYVDEGWWTFHLDRYSAKLSADALLTPNKRNPTAKGEVIKSGYGVDLLVNSHVTSTDNKAVTGTQNAMSYFPEFYYRIYWRLMDLTGSGHNSQFQFKQNPYSTYGERVHFTPIWMPDGAYTVYTYLFDAWTPVGELRMNLKDNVTIQGNLWSDWHIAPQNYE